MRFLLIAIAMLMSSSAHADDPLLDFWADQVMKESQENADRAAEQLERAREEGIRREQHRQALQEALNRCGQCPERKDIEAELAWMAAVDQQAQRNFCNAMNMMESLNAAAFAIFSRMDEYQRYCVGSADIEDVPVEARNGDPEAQYRWGRELSNMRGRERPKALPLAVTWFEKAASQGHLGAQVALADCYLYGTGVAVDEKRAMSLYLDAAHKGDSVALWKMGQVYEKGQGVPRDEAKAAEWYRRAADAGNLSGDRSLAQLYEEGRGVSKDLTRARGLYEKGAARGDRFAQGRLTALDAAVAAQAERNRVESGGVDGNGNTALHLAIWERQSDTALAIVRKGGIDLNQRNKFGATALHLAAGQGDKTLVEALLAAGADRHVRDNVGAVPLVYAQRNGFAEIVALPEWQDGKGRPAATDAAIPASRVAPIEPRTKEVATGRSNPTDPSTKPSRSQRSIPSSGSPANVAVAAARPAKMLAGGTYRVAGTTPEGKPYAGTCTVTKVSDNVYDFRWSVGSTYSGRGSIQGDTITVHWGSASPVVYAIQSDGSLLGRWDNGRAVENLYPR